MPLLAVRMPLLAVQLPLLVVYLTGEEGVKVYAGGGMPLTPPSTPSRRSRERPTVSPPADMLGTFTWLSTTESSSPPEVDPEEVEELVLVSEVLWPLLWPLPFLEPMASPG